MRPVILYRGEEFIRDELLAATKAGFYCTDSRLDIKADDVVVGRYSVLPFYREQERDINRVGARLINTYSEHCYIADMGQWYDDIKGYTPSTWTTIIDIPDSEQGPFIIKGQTNSKKFNWDTHMYAKDRQALRDVMSRLLDDTMISQQKLYIRKFEQFETYGYGLHGLPVTAEYRFFTYKGCILSGGYYWSSHVEDLEDFGVNKEFVMDPSRVPSDFLDKILNLVNNNGDRSPALVIDVARKVDGTYTVVEFNDLQMSGLSENNPDIMYQNLYKVMMENPS